MFNPWVTNESHNVTYVSLSAIKGTQFINPRLSQIKISGLHQILNYIIFRESLSMDLLNKCPSSVHPNSTSSINIFLRIPCHLAALVLSLFSDSPNPMSCQLYQARNTCSSSIHLSCIWYTIVFTQHLQLPCCLQHHVFDLFLYIIHTNLIIINKLTSIIISISHNPFHDIRLVHPKVNIYFFHFIINPHFWNIFSHLLIHPGSLTSKE